MFFPSRADEEHRDVLPFWKQGQCIVGHPMVRFDPLFESAAWATLIGYRRQYTWLAADPTFSCSKLYSGRLPGETISRQNLRTGVRGAQCEFAAFLGLNMPPTALADTHIRSIHTDYGKDIVATWKGEKITVDVKGIARPGSRDEAFGPLNATYRGVPFPPHHTGGAVNKLFVPNWQRTRLADVYVQVMHEPDTFVGPATRDDTFVCTLLGAFPASLLTAARRGKCEGLEAATSLLEIDEAFDHVISQRHLKQ
jgi:hypothetical protein